MKKLDALFSLGAAVVIFGALAKILHWRFADTALMAGMLTEVAIFLIYAGLAFFKPSEPKISNDIAMKLPGTQEALTLEIKHAKESLNALTDITKQTANSLKQGEGVGEVMGGLKENVVALNQSFSNILKALKSGS